MKKELIKKVVVVATGSVFAGLISYKVTELVLDNRYNKKRRHEKMVGDIIEARAKAETAFMLMEINERYVDKMYNEVTDLRLELNELKTRQKVRK